MLPLCYAIRQKFLRIFWSRMWTLAKRHSAKERLNIQRPAQQHFFECKQMTAGVMCNLLIFIHEDIRAV